MFCESCGNKLLPDAKFCDSCGAAVTKQAAPESAPVQPAPQAYTYAPADVVTEKPSVGFVDAVKLYFKNFTNFSGRSRRSEYWYATLFVTIVNTLVSIIVPDLSWLPVLVFMIPSLSLCVRRLHDVGKSGWFYLWLLLPLAGAIILLIQVCKDSEGDNQYGPSPKY